MALPPPRAQGCLAVQGPRQPSKDGTGSSSKAALSKLEEHSFRLSASPPAAGKAFPHAPKLSARADSRKARARGLHGPVRSCAISAGRQNAVEQIKALRITSEYSSMVVVAPDTASGTGGGTRRRPAGVQVTKIHLQVSHKSMAPRVAIEP